MRSFTAYAETDNVGPILVDAHVLVDGKKHQLGQEGVFDGDGYNATKLTWTGELPLSRIMPNILVVSYSNYCGDDADVRFTGTVKK